MFKKFTILSLLFALAFIGCEEKEPTGIWDKNDPGGPTPVVNSVTPPDSTYGGIDRKVVEFQGDNFSSDINGNQVAFGGKWGETIEATETKLTVIPPANFTDSMAVKVAVNGSYLFGTYTDVVSGDTVPHPYKLKSPITRPGIYTTTDNVGGIWVDNQENLFVSRKKKVDKITPSGKKIENIGELRKESNNIKIGPGGAFYYTSTLIMFKTDTTTFDHIYARFDDFLSDFDFGSNGNLFAAGPGGAVYWVNTTDISNSQIVSEGDTTFSVVRVYNDELYLVGKYAGTDTAKSTAQNIWKFDIDLSSDTLVGPIENVMDFAGTQYENINITSLTFNDQGTMYLGTTTNGLLYVEPSGGSYNPAGLMLLYPNLLGAEEFLSIFRMTWGSQDYLYVNNQNSNSDIPNTVYRIRVFENGAPYYGRD